MPFRTSTHSAWPFRLRITNVRSVVVTTLVFGTKRAGCARRTGHFTDGYIPGESESSRFMTSTSTAMVRDLFSTVCARRATVPE